MDELVLAFDVGGTNTRARVAHGAQAVAADDVSARIASAEELYRLIGDVVESLRGRGRVAGAAAAVAGPVAGDESRPTNWPSDSVVRLSELERAGLPVGRTLLMNDVVAGAWGALARFEADEEADRPVPLSAGAAAEHGLGTGNVVYVAPGTGLGAAALVRHGLGPLGASAVGCEAQHTPAPAFDGETGRVAGAVTGTLGHPPSWEELVSGRGLVHIYDALGEVAGAAPAVLADDEDAAGGIAAAAREGGDARAVEAVHLFYEVLGRFAQVLALSFQPCAAVIVGGTSTEQNLELLRSSRFAGAFADHPRLGGLLGGTGLYTVGGEVNLEGGVWLAERS